MFTKKIKIAFILVVFALSINSFAKNMLLGVYGDQTTDEFDPFLYQQHCYKQKGWDLAAITSPPATSGFKSEMTESTTSNNSDDKKGGDKR